MKINDTISQTGASSELGEQFFSIQDHSMIFDILRSKMYSNPVSAICREISCNARDAHREVGKADVPIQIHLPNVNEPFLKIKDFGPGISPERMSNVFIKYASSTKRADNVQTGGFGLGAKTPFAYSDSFSIKTNYNGTAYNYACFIDETKIGKLTLLSESPTTDSNGTEIIVPVKPSDFSAFVEYVEKSVRHWSIKPLIKGGVLSFQSPEMLISGDDWSITQANSWNRAIKLIIDEIEYPLDLTAARSFADLSLIDASRGNIHLLFGVGELSLSANREQVYLDKSTKILIENKIAKATKEIREKIQNDINQCSNLWDANIFYRKSVMFAFNKVSFLGDLKWNGIALHPNGHIDVDCTVLNFSKGKSSRYHGSPEKISRSHNRSIVFEENSILCVNDTSLKDISTRHIKKIFESTPNLKSVQVICLGDNMTLSTLDSNFHLGKMTYKLLSSFVTVSTRRVSSQSSRLNIYTIISNYDASFKHIPYSSLKGDTVKSKVFTLLSKVENNRYALVNGKKWNTSLLNKAISLNPSYAIYGVETAAGLDRLMEDFPDAITLEEFLEEKVLGEDTKNLLEIKSLNFLASKLDFYFSKQFDKLKITDPQSIANQKINLYRKITSSYSDQDLTYLAFFEELNGEIPSSKIADYISQRPDLDLESISNQYKNEYPLLEYLSGYKFDSCADKISQYINLIDADKKKDLNV